MASTTDYDFLAPESALGAVTDRDGFPAGTDGRWDADADDVFGELASGLYDEGVEHEVRALLGRVFGM